MSNQNIRRMAVAGQFYDASPATLEKQFEKFTSTAKYKLEEGSKVNSIIAPHAGYAYSGQTACDAYFQAKEGKYERIVLISPSHYVGFAGISLPDYGSAETPFGNIQLDLEAVSLLGPEYFIANSRPHLKEHSLEVHLPFIKHFFPDIKLIPLVCGQLDGSMIAPISESLSKLWNPNTLWVISSDFTHYGRSFGYMPFSSDIKTNLNKLDGSAIDKILSFDEKGFSSYVSETGATICGACPIRLILSILSKQKQSYHDIKSKLIAYTTSGDLTGDFSHCVSYASIAFYK